MCFTYNKNEWQGRVNVKEKGVETEHKEYFSRLIETIKESGKVKEDSSCTVGV